jgi:hypothetical protein
MKIIFKCQVCGEIFDGKDIAYEVELRHGQIAKYLQEIIDDRYLHDCSNEITGIGLLVGVKK